MKRAFVTGLILAWIGGSLAWAQSLDWKDFKSTEFSFSAVFPGEPSIDPPAITKKSDGSVSSTSTIFKCTSTGLFSMVGVTDYTFSFNVDDEFIADQTNFLKAIEGKLVSSRRAEYVSGKTKLPELTFTFEFPKMDYIGRAIVIGQGKRIYMAVFAYKRGMEYSTAMDKFLDSLELTGVPAT